jgi:hypothetical protein
MTIDERGAGVSAGPDTSVPTDVAYATKAPHDAELGRDLASVSPRCARDIVAATAVYL